LTMNIFINHNHWSKTASPKAGHCFNGEHHIVGGNLFCCNLL
jgi:hypothetical protein